MLICPSFTTPLPAASRKITPLKDGDRDRNGSYNLFGTVCHIRDYVAI